MNYFFLQTRAVNVSTRCTGGGSISSLDSDSTGHVESTSLGTASTPVPEVLTNEILPVRAVATAVQSPEVLEQINSSIGNEPRNTVRTARTLAYDLVALLE